MRCSMKRVLSKIVTLFTVTVLVTVLTATFSLTALAGSFTISDIGDTTYVQFNNKRITFNKVGNTIYGSDGSKIFKVGGNVYYQPSNGTRIVFTLVGDTWRGSDGTQIYNFGQDLIIKTTSRRIVCSNIDPYIRCTF